MAIAHGESERPLDAQQPYSRSLRAFLAVRSRYAEDLLGRAVEGGIRQYVVLGAGLDTFAYRNRFQSAGLHVFEVDHPATQEWKRAQLHQAGIAIPGDMTFAAVDFEREPLELGLLRAGFDKQRPAFFSWIQRLSANSPRAPICMLESRIGRSKMAHASDVTWRL